MTSTTNYVCNPVMCDCPSFNHPCVDVENRLFEMGLHKGDSNFDVLPRDLIEKIGGFLLHPEYEEQIIHSATGHYPVPGAPKVPKALASFEQQSSYVQTSLNPLTVPIREAADAYRWNEFKKKSVNPITILTLVAIGMAMETPLTLTAAKIASQFNGVQTLASIAMATGTAIGTTDGIKEIPGILKILKKTSFAIEVGVLTAFGVNPIAAFVTYPTALAAGIATGSVIKLGIDKTGLNKWRVGALTSGMTLNSLLVAAYVLLYNPFPIIENQST